MNKITRSAWSRLKRGFTLVELVIVIAVIAVLAAVLVPTFITVIDNANNSADLQLTASANTILSTDLSADSTATVENLRKLLKDNGITDLTTKQKDNVILYNKEAKKFELKKLNDKTAIGVKDPEASAGTAKTVAADNGDLQVDFAAYCPEEVFAGYILVSTGGNPLSESLYKLHNWETTPTESSDILKHTYSINENIRSALIPIISQTLYVAKDGEMFRLKSDSSGVVTVNNDTSDVNRVVFNEEYSKLSLQALADKIDEETEVTVIIPKTVTDIEEASDTSALKDVTFAGNIDIVTQEDVNVSYQSLPEIQKQFADGTLNLANHPDFHVSKSTTGDYYYSSLADALSYAYQSSQLSSDKNKDKSVIIADNTYEIDGDIIIPEHITLKLPYDGTNTYGSPKEKATATSVLSFGDISKQKLLLTVDEGVTITNNGKIEVGGYVTGSGGSNLAGQTTGDYARINLGANAKIESYGDIDVYGFITENTENNGSQVIMHSGTMKMPFVVVEHRGGSIFYTIGTENGLVSTPTASPFNRFFIHNVSAKLTFESSAILLGDAKLKTDEKKVLFFTVPAQENQTYIKLIGNDKEFLIQLQNDSYVVAKLQAKAFNTDNAKSPIKLDIYGDMTLNSMSLALNVSGMSATVTTKGVLFPVSWYWQISFNPIEESGTATVDATAQDFKILPGGSVTVNKGVTLQAGNIAVYKKDSWTDAGIGGVSKYETGKGDGKLTVNGSLVAQTLGGEIQNCTEGNEGSITISSATTVTSKELTGYSGSVSKNTNKVTWDPPITLNLSFVPGTPDGIGTYIFTNGAWTKQTA